jgi:hypothetical protein
MSSEPTRRGHSLALRLTLWYSGIFAGSCALAFAFVYGLIVATVQERLDEDLSGIPCARSTGRSHAI